MNRKSIIEVSFIAIAFIACGLILYNGFFSKSGSSPVGTVSTTVTAPQNPLPYGDSFDYQKIDALQNTFKFGQITYPQLDPSQVGQKPVSQLIVPLPQNVPGT